MPLFAENAAHLSCFLPLRKLPGDKSPVFAVFSPLCHRETQGASPVRKDKRRFASKREYLFFHAAGVGALRQLLCGDGAVKAVAAGQVRAGKAVLRQDAAGKIAVKPGLAVDKDRLFGVKLRKMRPQRIERDIAKALQMTAAVFALGADIQQRRAAVMPARTASGTRRAKPWGGAKRT